MSERFKEPVLKTGDAATRRGFESHSLRQFSFIEKAKCFDLRKYPRGRRGSPAKGVDRQKPVRGFKSLLPRQKEQTPLGVCSFCVEGFEPELPPSYRVRPSAAVVPTKAPLCKGSWQRSCLRDCLAPPLAAEQPTAPRWSLPLHPRKRRWRTTPQSFSAKMTALAAARSRRGSDVPPAHHSTPRRRFATLTQGSLASLLRRKRRKAFPFRRTTERNPAQRLREERSCN